MITTEQRRVALETGAVTTVECWGDAGPAVLCVHGIGASRRDFARLGEALAATHRVFAYDQRGHGDHAQHDGPLTLDALAADLRAVADSIGTVASVVGHAWGGAVALAGGPKIAKALVLVEPMLRGDDGSWDLRERLAALKIRTTILLAGTDSLVAPGDLTRISPSVSVRTIADHGHALHRTAFDAFADAVTSSVPA